MKTFKTASEYVIVANTLAIFSAGFAMGGNIGPRKNTAVSQSVLRVKFAIAVGTGSFRIFSAQSVKSSEKLSEKFRKSVVLVPKKISFYGGNAEKEQSTAS